MKMPGLLGLEPPSSEPLPTHAIENLDEEINQSIGISSLARYQALNMSVQQHLV